MVETATMIWMEDQAPKNYSVEMVMIFCAQAAVHRNQVKPGIMTGSVVAPAMIR